MSKSKVEYEKVKDKRGKPRSLAPVQKLIQVFPWEQGVVPIGQSWVFEEVELGHLSIGDFNFGGVVHGAQAAVDL